MSPNSATIIGSPVSPYVRKVLAVCEMKGIAYRLDPIVPFFGDDRFSDLSPLRRVPVFVDDKLSLCDSTAICEYLEERYPTPRLLPVELAQRAQARWIEEFSDTRMGDVFIWRIFYEAVILPFVFQRTRDKAKIATATAEQLPNVMTYLETIAPGDGFVFGELSIADLAVAIPFSNLKWARVEPDVVSPDGSKVALINTRTGRNYRYDLVIATIDGTVLKRVEASTFQFSRAAFAGPSTVLANQLFKDRYEVTMVDLADYSVRIVATVDHSENALRNLEHIQIPSISN